MLFFLTSLLALVPTAVQSLAIEQPALFIPHWLRVATDASQQLDINLLDLWEGKPDLNSTSTVGLGLSEALSLVQSLRQGHWDETPSWLPALRYYALRAQSSRRFPVWARSKHKASDAFVQEATEIHTALEQFHFALYPDRDACSCVTGSDFYMAFVKTIREGRGMDAPCTEDLSHLLAMHSDHIINDACMGGVAAHYVAELHDCVLRGTSHLRSSIAIFDFLFRLALVGGPCLASADWALTQDALLEGYGLFAYLLAESPALKGQAHNSLHTLSQTAQVAIHAALQAAWSYMSSARARQQRPGGEGESCVKELRGGVCILPKGLLVSTDPSLLKAEERRAVDDKAASTLLPPELRPALRGAVTLQLCADNGEIKRTMWVIEPSAIVGQQKLPLPAAEKPIMLLAHAADFGGTNLWHSLHWWAPLIELAQLQGLQPESTQLVFVPFKGSEFLRKGVSQMSNWAKAGTRDAMRGPWNEVSRLIHSFVTAHPVVWLPDVVKAQCFQKAVVGLPRMRLLLDSGRNEV
ncbi:unnamed protein product, partial [Polarella glacialis]